MGGPPSTGPWHRPSPSSGCVKTLTVPFLYVVKEGETLALQLQSQVGIWHIKRVGEVSGTDTESTLRS